MKTSFTMKMAVDLHEELKSMAERHDTTVADLMRKGIKWVFLADTIEQNGGAIYIKLTADDELTRIMPF